MLQIFALACSADQKLFCFYKMLLMRCSGKMSTEQIVKLSFNVRPVANFQQYLFDFSILYAIKLYLSLHIDDRFTKAKL